MVNLVLGLAAHAHPAGRLGLAIEHHDVGAVGVKQPEQGRLGGHLDDLHVRNVHRGTTPDGELYLASHIRVVAVHNDFHDTHAIGTPANPGGRVAIAYRLS